MFVPQQDGQGEEASDFNCSNDPIGCWVPSYAVIDNQWQTGTWSGNIPSDYAFLVASNVGSHTSDNQSFTSDALEEAVPALDVSFEEPTTGSLSYAFGYPGNRDPNFQYCRQVLDPEQGRGYLLDGCDMQGGSSGGP